MANLPTVATSTINEPGTSMLFWNVQGKPVANNIVRLAGLHNADIILLAESPFWSAPSVLLDLLNALPSLPGRRPYVHISTSKKTAHQHVQVFSRTPYRQWRVSKEHSRYTLWRLKTTAQNDLLLTAAHFPDVRNEQGDGQRKTAIDLRSDLALVERFYTQDDTTQKGFKGAPLVIIGDLNANPFDEGIAGVYGLNATQRRAVALEGVRELEGRHYPFLYNPMWQFYGAREKVPPGTYYKRLSRPICYDWFLLDQVLTRPFLLPFFDDSDVTIPVHDGVASLVQGGDARPRRLISDHLPLVFRLRY